MFCCNLISDKAELSIIDGLEACTTFLPAMSQAQQPVNSHYFRFIVLIRPHTSIIHKSLHLFMSLKPKTLFAWLDIG